MSSLVRKSLHAFVPSNFHNVAHLAKNLIQHPHSAGKMAMVYAGLGVVVSPFDKAMKIREAKLHPDALTPEHPVIFVCGAPRSGTTMMGQSLIKTLDVHFFNNLTSLFPHAPITAQRWFKSWVQLDRERMKISSLYGRTARLKDPNDGLYFWDKWRGTHDRKEIPTALSEGAETEIPRFFAKMEAQYGLPVLQKNNSLNTFAHLVAPILPTAQFVCMDRDPVYHAQSLLLARRFIHNDDLISYGTQGYEGIDPMHSGVESVCHQVVFHKEIAKRQQALVGADRFRIISYEDFCEQPAETIDQLAKDILGSSPGLDNLRKNMAQIQASTKQKLSDEEFGFIQDFFQRWELEQAAHHTSDTQPTESAQSPKVSKVGKPNAR
ncbi:sulfotransferase [Pontibacter sp. G13]|uniref:sulfotransferase family protein n=1 Tax=Pontibacter sp. G13 TaxID=3074898 RepID=UPI00288A29F8|nr:sulfotransferase [Pontibacter sp. G13]WNJ17073.1 sulfotransferase [Pontibacter sp. G13]